MRRLLVGLAAVGLLAAQEASKQDAPDSLDTVFKQNVKNVQAPVTVLDRDGNVVSGLNTLDFTLFDNGKEQKITEDFASHPISLVVAVQATANVEAIIPQIQKIGSLFDQLVAGANGEMAVLAFDHQIKTMTGFTDDADKIHAAFKHIKAGSWTSKLNDATMQGVNMLRTRPADRKRVMIIISEVRDNGSGMHVRDVLTAQEFANVVVYSVNMSRLVAGATEKAMPNRPDPIPPGGEHLPNGQVMTPTLETQQNQNGNWTPVFTEIFKDVKAIFVPNPLQVYTRYTGGREYTFLKQRGLEQAIAKIGDDLHNQYLLTYSPNNQNEPGFHTIRVTVDKPDLKVYTRDGYWLAGKAQ